MRQRNQIRSLLLLSSVLLASPLTQEAAAAGDPFDERPMPVKSVSPVYPAEMKRAGASGLVTLTVLINENGDVVERKVAKSTRPEFESSAMDAVGKWKFKPAKKAGIAVKALITIPIKFTNES